MKRDDFFLQYRLMDAHLSFSVVAFGNVPRDRHHCKATMLHSKRLPYFCPYPDVYVPGKRPVKTRSTLLVRCHTHAGIFRRRMTDQERRSSQSKNKGKYKLDTSFLFFVIDRYTLCLCNCFLCHQFDDPKTQPPTSACQGFSSVLTIFTTYYLLISIFSIHESLACICTRRFRLIERGEGRKRRPGFGLRGQAVAFPNPTIVENNL